MAIPFHLPTPEETEDSYRLIYQLLNDLCDVLRQIVIGQRQIPIEVPPQPAPRNRNNGGRRAEVEEPRVGLVGESVRTESDVPTVPVLLLPDIVLSTLSSSTTTTSPCVAQSHTNNTNSVSTTSTISSTTASGINTSSSSNISNNEQQQSSQPPQRPPRRRRRTPRISAKNTHNEPAGRQNDHIREDWLKVGEDLRKIADEFRASLQEANRKPPPAEPSLKAQTSLLSLLLPAPLKGSLWTAAILLLGWRLFQATL